MSWSPTSPSGGGSGAGAGGAGGTGASFLGGLLGRAARSVFDSAMNSTATTNTTATENVTVGRSFFDFGSSNSSTDIGSWQVIEYSGRNANNEIASIYPISLRAGDLILHGPRKDAEGPPSNASYLRFNIILHATNASSSSERMYSLFRTDIESEATRIFVIFKQIFPDLVKASTTPLDKQTLEKIVNFAKNNESFQAAHVAAALGLVEHLKSPVLREKFAEQEGKHLHTPLQVACVNAKLDAVRAICEDAAKLYRVFDYTDTKGNTVVHLAAECKDKAVGAAILKILQEKLAGAPQSASTNRALLDLFMKLNNEGLAPIHLACLNENKEAVEKLVGIIDVQVFESSPTGEAARKKLKLTHEMTNARATATGNTPLHFATSNPALLGHLLLAGADPNVADNEGITPLHKAVIQNNLKSVLLLLSNNAYNNFTATFDAHNDATPLHVAAATCAMDCLKALIVFGADLEAKDGNGYTARHIVATIYNGSSSTKNDTLFVLSAAGAKRCDLGVAGGCHEGCKAGGRQDGRKPDSWRVSKDGTGSNVAPDSLVQEAMRGLNIVRESLVTGTDTEALRGGKDGPVKGGRVLSLDGGGIRGLVLTQILFFMEKEFGTLSGGAAPIVSYFDWVAGTSTGGILALALACGKSVLETQSLYMKLKDKVFTGDRPYSSARMEEFLKNEFGPDTKMSSIQKPKVMIMTSLANRRPPDLYIFRNYISPCSLVGEPEEYTQFPDDTFIWECAKVTGAAPSFFTLDHEVFIDGGLISNNPTLDALAELVQFKAVMMGSQQTGRCNDNEWKLPSLVLSLGTGIPPKEECSATNLDVNWPTGVFDAIKNVPRLKQLVNLLVDQATQAEGQVPERARAWCTSIGVPFFRFSPEMGEHIELDEKRDDVLVNLMWETWCYMVGNRDKVREIFERLRELDVSGTSSK